MAFVACVRFAWQGYTLHFYISHFVTPHSISSPLMSAQLHGYRIGYRSLYVSSLSWVNQFRTSHSRIGHKYLKMRKKAVKMRAGNKCPKFGRITRSTDLFVEYVSPRAFEYLPTAYNPGSQHTSTQSRTTPLSYLLFLLSSPRCRVL